MARNYLDPGRPCLVLRTDVLETVTTRRGRTDQFDRVYTRAGHISRERPGSDVVVVTRPRQFP